MARKKGVPQRTGLSRAEAARLEEEEARSRRLEELDRALEERSKAVAAEEAEEDERADEQLSSSPVRSKPAPTVPSPVMPQVYYSTPSPPVPNGFAPPSGDSRPLHAIPPPPPLHPAPFPSVHAPSFPALPPSAPLYAILPPAFLQPPMPPPSTNGKFPPPVQEDPTSAKFEAPPGLSRFAQKYVPLWLRNVNAQVPMMVVPRSVSESFTIDYPRLHDVLYSPHLLNLQKSLERKHVTRIAAALLAIQRATGGDANSAIPPAPLTRSSYALHFLPNLHTEFHSRHLQLQQASLYHVPLRLVPRHPAEPPGPPSFALEAKSIREGWPPVDIGDLLTLRQLRPAYQSWQGLEFSATVAGINRAAGEVILRCDGLLSMQESMIFNVSWKVQDRIFYNWRRAVEILDMHLNADTKPASATVAAESRSPRKRSAVESWLFPTTEDVVTDAPPPEKEDIECEWVDSSLNEEQRNAVRSILWGQQRLPLLLHGPPGTGKTKTLVEAVLQLLKRDPTCHILVCGASNPSTDTLAMRLRSLAPKELLRLNSPSRPFAEVRAELLPFCHVEDERFALPDMTTLLSKRVICCTVVETSLLWKARATNHDLSTLEIFVRGYIHPHVTHALAQPHFNYLLVDEAAQATEMDLGCALSVVATNDTRCKRAHVTICGDYRQLGPHITSEEARAHDMDVSLLERLMQRPVYADHPYARKNRRLAPDAVWDVRTTPFVDLVRNYRSTPEILWLPSTEFYNETLVPSASSAIQNSPLRNWSCLPKPGFPILFKHVAGDDLEVDDGASFFNEAEVNVVKQLIVDLVRPPRDDPTRQKHGVVSPKEISVISPFREQVWRIRLALRQIGLGEVDVGNVEALQGAENRVVIISTVRSKELRWLPIDRAQNRGLLFEPKRFNVAMTRAKELLLVVGNAETLTMDPHWKSFYRLCLRNDCYVGPPVTNPSANEAGHAVSKLEAEYVREKRRRAGALNGHASSRSLSEQGHTTNGHAAAEGEEQDRDEARDFDILIGRLASQLVNEDDDFPPLRAG
ncbi:hypothetical protein JCM11251_007429 [Rhodosporidiobolus azoricus]